MNAIFGILDMLLDVAFFIMIVHIIFSWLIAFQVLNLYQPLVAQIWDGLNRLLEPIYAPIRRMLPNTGGLDLAPLVAFLILIAVRDFILPDLYRALI
ncbi:MAG: YggT family protein [Pseudomonadota bacterium]